MGALLCIFTVRMRTLASVELTWLLGGIWEAYLARRITFDSVTAFQCTVGLQLSRNAGDCLVPDRDENNPCSHLHGHVFAYSLVGPYIILNLFMTNIILLQETSEAILVTGSGGL
jgi:hypothetical protein